MDGENIFELEAARYDDWFERHPAAYESEVEALRAAMPAVYRQPAEIGSGTGRFAGRFGISRGVEPAASMRTIAETRGVYAVPGSAEALPFDDSSCDLLLMVTTICFVDDPLQSCREAMRVLQPGGRLLVGLIDRDSFLGREYEVRRASSMFYRTARFFSAKDIETMLLETGFTGLQFWQTLFHHPDEMTAPDPAMSGHGRGAFVVAAADKDVRDGK